jgi:hypothetical protein
MENLGRFGHKSLPTYYKGITFRSRLEARWAIILNQLGIAWEYEPEAIVIEGYGESDFSYLPDFYLPAADAFLEVKGNLELKDIPKTLQIAHAITTNGGGRPFENENDRPFLIAGNLGNEIRSAIPISIFNYKGDLFMNRDYETVKHVMDICPKREKRNYCDKCYQTSIHIGSDYDWTQNGQDISHFDLAYRLCNNYQFSWQPIPEWQKETLPHGWTQAINKGKTARFDNGVYRGN